MQHSKLLESYSKLLKALANLGFLLNVYFRHQKLGKVPQAMHFDLLRLLACEGDDESRNHSISWNSLVKLLMTSDK